MLIETILAAFEMEEILYELREHAAGLNAGRWDYLFSMIKKFRDRPDMVLPDRAQVTMTVPFMRAYTELLVQDLPPARRPRHRRHGGLHPEPSRCRGQRRRARQGARGQDRAKRGDGFDGAWVAHPDLVPVVQEVFDAELARPAQPEGAAAGGGCRSGARSCWTCGYRRTDHRRRGP